MPVHHGKDLAPGTLRALIRQSGFSVEEFVAALQALILGVNLERWFDTEFVHRSDQNADIVAEHLAKNSVDLSHGALRAYGAA